MTTYYTNEAAFTLPALGFTDETVHSVEVRLPEDRELRILVARRPVPAGQSFRAAVAEQVKGQTTRVSGYAVLERRDATVAGRPAIVMRARWRKDQVAFYERQAHLSVAEGSRLLIALTGPALAEADCDAHFERVLGSLTLRDAN